MAKIILTLPNGSGGGSGNVVNYIDLLDKTTVNLPIINTPLSDILDNKQNQLIAGTNINIDNTNPLAPVISAASSGGDFIPLSGTTVGNPVTGDIETDSGSTISIFKENLPDQYKISFHLGDNLIGMSNLNTLDLTEAAVFVRNSDCFFSSNSPLAKGFTGAEDYTANITDLDYTQKIYVDTGLSGKQNTLVAGTNITIDNTNPLLPIISAASGAGATDLTYTVSPTNGVVTSSTGTDATVPLADGTNAGLLKPAKYTVLENTSGTNSGDQDLSGLQPKDTQISITTSQDFQSAWNGQTIFVGANVTLTVPASLASEYGFNFVLEVGFTITWAITSPHVWAGTTPTTTVSTTEPKIGNITKKGSTNNIYLFQ